jgi:DNA-binding beta-propeller fold protein YncE
VIPISVGNRPRQVELVGTTVYVTDYNSSDVYEIDARSSRVVGRPVSLPVNPFAITAEDGTVWVTSQPENRLSVLTTGRGG